jgi:hypothetical protein
MRIPPQKFPAMLSLQEHQCHYKPHLGFHAYFWHILVETVQVQLPSCEQCTVTVSEILGYCVTGIALDHWVVPITSLFSLFFFLLHACLPEICMPRF